MHDDDDDDVVVFHPNRFALPAGDIKGARNVFNCVACHPKEDCVATGHGDGKIRFW